jgi:hypothetical protein
MLVKRSHDTEHLRFRETHEHTHMNVQSILCNAVGLYIPLGFDFICVVVGFIQLILKFREYLVFLGKLYAEE